MPRVVVLVALAILGVLIGAMTARGRAHETPPPCTTCGAMVTELKAVSPAFGDRSRPAARVTYELAETATVRVDVLRGRRVISRTRAGVREAGVRYALRLPARGLPRGVYTFRLTASRGDRRVTTRVVSRRV